MVGGDPGATGTATTGNWFAKGECAWLRESAQVPLPTRDANVGDSLHVHGVHGRKATLPVGIERRRDLETEVVGTPMAGPAFDNGVENFGEPIIESTERVVRR